MADVRPIDANALIKMMVAENNRRPGVSWEITDIERYVTKLLPTINPDDLRPRGRWVHDHYENCTEQFEIVKCSNCGFTAYAMAVFVKGGNYCPNCGAKMDGKEQTDDNT